MTRNLLSSKRKKTVYAPRSIKRIRRTKAEIAAIDDALIEIVTERQPTTCRHVFYCACSQGFIAKTEPDYKQVVCRRLKYLRRSGRIPWGYITDNTRWHIKSPSYASIHDALDEMQSHYRRDLWGNQDDYVEVWCEKDAIAGILSKSTRHYDAPLMVVRGFSSLSFLYDMAENMKAIDKPTYIYYFGDHDPSGLAISKCIERELRQFAPEVDLHFERLAVTPEQIIDWELPTRPTKKTDTRSKTFKGESVEVDAIDPRKLVRLASDAIERHIDPRLLRQTQRIEASERETLETMIASMQEDSDD